MPSGFSHAFVGAALGALFRRPGPPVGFWLAGAACAAAPDLDVIGVWLGVPWGSVLGHRGITHSIAFAVVLGAAVAFALPGREWQGGRLKLWLFFSVATATHGVLDGLNRAGSGVAFFAPFDDTRYFMPWRLTPGTPIGLAFFSARGLAVFQAELLMIWLPVAGLAMLAWLLRARESSR